LVARQGISDVRGPASRLIAELFSLGVLSERQYEVLIEGQKTRGSVAHGRAVGVRPDLVSQLASLARWLASEAFASTDEMVEHFLSTYEDPAQHVPHDSAEGGRTMRAKSCRSGTQWRPRKISMRLLRGLRPSHSIG
jgi:hypothetical protein